MAPNIRLGEYSVLILFLTVFITFHLNVAFEVFQYIEIDTDDNDSDQSAPRLINSSSSIEFLDGQWVGTFACSFEGWPLPEISWHNQGGIRIKDEFGKLDITVQNDGQISTSILIVGAFQESNASQYSCLAVNAKGFEDGVIWPNSPPLLLVKANTVVSPGDTIIAECRSYAGAKLIWKLPGSKEIHKNVNFTTFNDAVNSTSVITFSATETDNTSPYMCCIVLKNPEKVISPACTNFTLRVYSKPSLTFHQGCSSNNEHFPKCELACRFTGFPVPRNVIWEYCPRIDQCYEIVSQPFSFISSTAVASQLELENAKQGIYRCKVNDGGYAEHIFNITRNQIAPKLVRHNFSIGIADEVVKVNFTCVFSANPTPVIKWMRKEYLWSNGTETLISDEINFIITEELISENVYQTTLLVNSYGEDAWVYSYFCKAESKNGLAESPPLVAYIKDDFLVLNTSKSDAIFEDGVDVNVSCYSGGYPPPLINLRVVSEYDVMLTFSRDKFVNNVTFTADWHNSYTKVECTAVYPMQPVKLESTSIAVYVDHESVITNVHNCTPEDFEVNGTCTLQCEVHTSPLSHRKYFAWLYFTNDVYNDTSFYIIMDGINVTNINPNITIYSLKLNEYYSAYYQFYIQLFNPVDEIEELEHVFKIDPNEIGVPLGDACRNSSDCMAYYSKCQNYTCECIQSNYIPMDMNSNTSACLTEAEPGMMCYNDMQCASAAFNYNCTISHTCECEGVIIHDHPNDTEVKCVDPRRIGQRCTDDDQCYLFDERSECESNICKCKPGYSYTTFDFRCESENKEMNPGEIFGIVLLGLLLVGLLAYFIKRYRDNKKLKKMLEERRNIWPETEWDSSEKEYSTFDNSSLQFQESGGHIRMSSVRNGSSTSSFADVRL